MKHVLLGSTALVAAGLMAGAASAAEPVKLGIQGFYQAAIGGNIDEGGDFDGDLRSHSVETNGEIRFHGETTLDNGLTVGARIELEAFDSSDQFDQAYAFISGGFGEVRLGDTLEALSQMCYLAPQAGNLFGADSPNFNFANAGVAGYGATNGTCYGMAGQSSSIIYFSPNFGGFSFGVSYAPETSDSFGGGVANLGASSVYTVGTFGTFGTGQPSTEFDNNGNIENMFSLAASFVQDFNGFSIAVGGGATFGEGEISNVSTEDYNAYLNVGFGGWTVGGALEIREDVGAISGNDNWVGAVGTTYNWDAWTVGLTWSHGEYDIGDEDKYDIIQFTGAYALGPGISLEGMVGYADYRDGGNDSSSVPGTDGDYDAIEIGTGIHIGF